MPESREGNDIYFLVDRSGSMAEEKWTKTAEALIAFAHAAAQITHLDHSFRIELPGFRSEAPGTRCAARDPKFQSIAALGIGGGTELLPALQHIMAVEQQFSTQRRSHIVLITDGQIGNEEAVSGSFRARTPRSLFRNRPCGQRSIPPPTGPSTAGNQRFAEPE